MTRINVSGPSGSSGGGFTQADADLLYVKLVGDVMSGSLELQNTDATQVTSNSPLLLLDWYTLGGPYHHQSALYGQADDAGGGPTAFSAVWLQHNGPYGIGTGAVGIVNFNSGDVLGWTSGDDAVISLGHTAKRWKNLYLSGNLTDDTDSLTVAQAKTAYTHSQSNSQSHTDYLLNNAADEFGGTLSPSTDEVYDLGTTSKGLRQVIFSDASSGSNRAKFRGNKCIGYSGADIYWGIDDIFPGYFVQKTVVAGSTKTDNTDDYTNLYQGDSAYPFVAIQFGIARTADGVNNATNGLVLGDSGPGTLGAPLIFKAGSARRVEMYLDETNSIFRIEAGKSVATRIPKIEIRLQGTGPSIRPYATNLIDFGESALLWKDAYFAGDVRGRQMVATGDNAGIASTNSLTNVSDLTTNNVGVGAILFKGTTSRNSTGFIKVYVGTTAYYVPVFSAITG